jgi:DNA-binding beta-propeller fold protein YncE
VDGDGNVIVADTGNHRIRKITPQGHVSTLAGTGIIGHRDGEGNVAQFFHPVRVAVDGDGNVIVADMGNHRIRKITPQGRVSTLAGSGENAYRDGKGTNAQFNYPLGIAVDGDGNVIVADTGNHRTRKITPKGHVSSLAGTGMIGHRNGEGTVAQLNYPFGVAVDGDGNVVVADRNNHRIRKITP